MSISKLIEYLDEYESALAVRISRCEARRLIKHIGESRSLDSLLATLSSVHKKIDDFVLHFCSRRKITLACKAGCRAYCCLLRVEISPPEAFHIKNFIKNIFGDEAVETLRKKIHSAAIRAKDLTTAQFVNARISCPFLEKNQCLIYSARPIMCRVFHSTDLYVCAYTDKHPGQTKMDSRVPILYLGARAYLHGFCNALKEVGLDRNTYEMCQVLDVVLFNVTAFKEWRKGKQIFPPLPPEPAKVFEMV